MLDNDKLIFTYDDLLEGEPLRCRSARVFEEQYLRKGFSDKITILRVLDSRRENFKLSKAYMHKVDVINIITAPEIEMFVIHAEGKYNDYKKSGKKPSLYCKENLKFGDVKSSKFLREYFKDITCLVAAITEYKRVSKSRVDEYSLADLIK